MNLLTGLPEASHFEESAAVDSTPSVLPGSVGDGASDINNRISSGQPDHPGIDKETNINLEGRNELRDAVVSPEQSLMVQQTPPVHSAFDPSFWAQNVERWFRSVNTPQLTVPIVQNMLSTKITGFKAPFHNVAVRLQGCFRLLVEHEGRLLRLREILDSKLEEKIETSSEGECIQRMRSRVLRRIGKKVQCG